MARVENCPDCTKVADRIPFPRKTYLIGTAVQNAEYNPGLGMVVNNKEHRSEIAKQRGLVEVGNDYGSGEANQQHFEKEREAKKEKGWAEVAQDVRQYY